MDVFLRPMCQEEFARFAQWSVDDYAEELIAAGKETAETAPGAAWQEFREAFPAGVDSEGVVCNVIEGEDHTGIGVITYEAVPSRPGTAFITEFVIAKACRGRGCGKAALQKLQEEAKNKGFPKMRLSVFHHNVRAVQLYESCGFREVKVFQSNSIMEKSI